MRNKLGGCVELLLQRNPMPSNPGNSLPMAASKGGLRGPARDNSRISAECARTMRTQIERAGPDSRDIIENK